MKISKLLIVALLVSLLILTLPVAAEVLTGDIGQDGITSLTFGSFGGANAQSPYSITAHDIETAGIPTAIIVQSHAAIGTADAGHPAGANTPVTFKDFGTGFVRGTGTIGVQFLYNKAGAQIGSYIWIVFNSLNTTYLTGDYSIYLDYNKNSIYNYTQNEGTNLGPSGSWSISSTVGYIGSYYTNNKDTSFHASYTVEKPKSLGIEGSILKTASSGGIVYNSRAYVFNATSGTLIANEPTLTSNTFNFTTSAQSIFIGMMDQSGVFHNSSVLFTVIPPTTPTPTPSPTPTPAPGTGGGFSIGVYPNSIPLTSTSTGTIYGSNFYKINSIAWSWSDDLGINDFYNKGNTSRPLTYVNTSGTWYEYDISTSSYSINAGAAIPNPVTLSNITTSGDKMVICFIGTTDGLWYTLYTPLTVIQAGGQTLTIQGKDFNTGSLVGYTSFAVQNVATGVWTNRTAAGGSYDFLYPFATSLYIEADAYGYAKATKYWSTTHTPTYNLWMIMYPGITAAATNVTLNVEVYDATTLSPVPGALVHVFRMLMPGGESKLTSSSGSTSFNTTQNEVYTIAVTKYGYQNAGMSLDVGAGGNTIDEVIMLHRAVAPTPTLTIPTAIPTFLPTSTITSPGGGLVPNYTGFWGPLYNFWGAMGADAFWIQTLMACMCVFVGVALGGFGAGTVFPGQNNFDNGMAQLGGIMGIVFGCAAGFISIAWIVVIFVFIGFKVFLMPR